MRFAWTAAALLVAARTAAADHSSLHATAVGSLAATDNANSAPDNGNSESDMFLQVRPGLLFTYETPRMTQEMAASVEALEFLRNSGEPSYSAALGIHSLYLTSPRSTMFTSIDAGTGLVGALTTRSAPDVGGVAIQPSTNVYTESVGASETAGYQWSQEIRIYEAGVARYATTDDDGASDPVNHQSNATLDEEVSLAVGGDRSWTSNSISLELAASLLHLERSAPSTAPPGTDRLDRQINPRVTATWRHDIDEHWSGSAAFGGVYIIPYGVDPFNPHDTTRRPQFLPVGTALVAYTDFWGHGSISVGRSVTPNQFIAQNTQNDSVAAAFSIPIKLPNDPPGREPRLVSAATLGYSRTTLLDPVFGADEGAFDVIRGDVGLSYAPQPNIQYGARFEYIKQIGEMSNNPQVQFFNFGKSTLFFTFSIRWPEQVAAQVPKSQSQRADRRDLAPIGEEQVVPDDSSSGGD